MNSILAQSMNTYVAIRDTVTTFINTIDALGRAEIFLTRNPPSIMRSHDMIARTYPQEYNRGRVHLKVMDARLGMRILDYVSLECPWNKYLQILSDKKKYGRLVRSFMFHVENHWGMSCSNAVNFTTYLTAKQTNLMVQIKYQLLVEPNRFDLKLETRLNINSNLLLKIF